jgi:hypothetical protein
MSINEGLSPAGPVTLAQRPCGASPQALGPCLASVTIELAEVERLLLVRARPEVFDTQKYVGLSQKR